MDSFESLIGTLLEGEGFWVRSEFKVYLTKEEKVAIGRPTTPRWELDLLGYKAKENRLFAVECKSYFDSIGVDFDSLFSGEYNPKSRYKLFREDVLREVVFHRTSQQLMGEGAIRPNPKFTLCLAVGKMKTPTDHRRIAEEFRRRKWKLFDLDWIEGRLKSMSRQSYDNNVAAVVAKIILRGSS